MIKQKFALPAQGAKVQNTTLSRGGITVTIDKNSVTVTVDTLPKKTASKDFRKGVEL